MSTARSEGGPGLCERRFWILASGVVLVSILTQTLDFSVAPPEYKGLFITRPYDGLHSWYFANRSWAARSHVKYGLGYTEGYHTPAVGNPPPAHPQRYVSHPGLESLIIAVGVMLFGARDWAIRLFDLILSAPILLLILLLAAVSSVELILRPSSGSPRKTVARTAYGR